LERPKYQYKYPIFHSPPDIPEAILNINLPFSGSKMVYLEGEMDYSHLKDPFDKKKFK